MATRLVDVEALNLRASAGVEPGNRIAVLHLGQPVEPLESAVSGWQKVRTEVDAQAQQGFVKLQLTGAGGSATERTSLRDELSPEREALVAAAVSQWKRFRYGLARETEDPQFRFIGEMWQAIGLPHDGLDTDIPWSAAAISFMVRQASGAAPKYGHFKFAANHSRYIHDAIKRHGDPQAPFWGTRISAQRPQIGDIVARWREVPVSFDTAATHSAFKSHTDIIVSLTPIEAIAIGGNVSDSVGLTRYPLTAAGFLSDAKGVIALLMNNA